MNYFNRKLNFLSFFIGIFFFLTFFTFVNLALAVSSAPSPICEIVGDVLNVEKTTTITPPLNAPSQKIKYYSVRLKIISVSTYQEDDLTKNFGTCDSLYSVNSKQETILFSDEYSKSPLIKGQQIKGRLHFSGDERFSGIFLSNISISLQIPIKEDEKLEPINIIESFEISKKLFDQKYDERFDGIFLPNISILSQIPIKIKEDEQKKDEKLELINTIKSFEISKKLIDQKYDERFSGTFLPNISISSQIPIKIKEDEQKKDEKLELINIIESFEISKKLIDQKYVDDIDDVLLQSNQKTYKTKGTKKGKLFFFIPVRINIQLEVDAITGRVKEIKKPWWAFLAR